MTRLLPAIALTVFALLTGMPVAAQDHDCVVRQYSLARNVVNLEPQGIVEGTYPAGTERAYVFARLDCTQVGSGEIFWFHWIHNDREVAKSKARVDVSRNWRIWTHSRIFSGDWAVVLKDSAGRQQAEVRFTIGSPDGRREDD